jgi:hypothetical protein
MTFLRFLWGCGLNLRHLRHLWMKTFGGLGSLVFAQLQ